MTAPAPDHGPDHAPNRGRGYFITASGTGDGKTLIACALGHQLRKKGLRVHTLKPVISGYGPDDMDTSDSGLILQSLGNAVDADAIAGISPWRYSAPIAPNMAAKREGGAIDLAALTGFCRDGLTGGHDITLIEGVGGVAAPINDDATVLDWMAMLGLPAVVVVGSYLGAISHGLTAVAALDARAIAIAGIVVNQSADNPVPFNETVACFRRFLPGRALVAVPRLEDGPRLWQGAPDLTETLMSLAAT